MNDQLDLWRGIDDAIWREALRDVPPAAPRQVLPAADRHGAQRRGAQRSPLAVLLKLPEPA